MSLNATGYVRVGGDLVELGPEYVMAGGALQLLDQALLVGEEPPAPAALQDTWGAPPNLT